MANRGWEGSGGGSSPSGGYSSSIARNGEIVTSCAEAEPFVRGSKTASHGFADNDDMGSRDDLFEVRGQGSTTN